MGKEDYYWFNHHPFRALMQDYKGDIEFLY
jgi:hypothetical protein